VALNYSDCDAALREIADQNVANKNRLASAKATVVTADTELGGMATKYGAVITTITAAAAAQPDNEAYQAMKARADALVADYQALKAEAAALRTAIGA
jgi:predicted xylose isomerase-like sugar epimerase